MSNPSAEYEQLISNYAKSTDDDAVEDFLKALDVTHVINRLLNMGTYLEVAQALLELKVVPQGAA